MSVISMQARTLPSQPERPAMRLVASGAQDPMTGLDDNARFRSIVMPHIDDAYRLAHWLTGNRTDAEDVVQDASLRAFRAIREYAGGNPRSWLLSIVRNTAYSWLRRKSSGHRIHGRRSRGGRARASQARRLERRNARSRADSKSRCRAAPRRDCGAAVSVPRDACTARRRGSRLPRDRRSN